jgi:hypothetical protein
MSQMKTFPRPVASNDRERKPGYRGGLLLMLALYSNPKWDQPIAQPLRQVQAAVSSGVSNNAPRHGKP